MTFEYGQGILNAKLVRTNAVKKKTSFYIYIYIYIHTIEIIDIECGLLSQ